MTTSRSDFNETWLAEMPARLGDFGETFSILKKSILDWISNGFEPEKISDGLFKITGENMIYYWYQDADDIIVAVELEKRPQGLVVTIVGKNPKFTSNPPYATDLYKAILSYSSHSLLFSDNHLSNDGMELWKKLILDHQYKVSVYNSKDPGKTFITLDNTDDLEKYMGPEYYNYRFVLSKKGMILAETRSYFNLRRYRELVPGMSLED